MALIKENWKNPMSTKAKVSTSGPAMHWTGRIFCVHSVLSQKKQWNLQVKQSQIYLVVEFCTKFYIPIHFPPKKLLTKQKIK